VKTFEVKTYYSDTCGNYNIYHYGFYKAKSLKQVREVFLEGGLFLKWVVTEIIPKPSPAEIPLFPKEP